MSEEGLVGEGAQIGRAILDNAAAIAPGVCLGVKLDDPTLAVFRIHPDGTAAFGVLRFTPEGRTIHLRIPSGFWRRRVDSAEETFGGLAAKSPALLPLGVADGQRLRWSVMGP